jgi:uncharacterized membrane protein
MKTEQVKITPAMAEQWFLTVLPEKQRTFRDRHACEIRDAILRGEWVQNNDMFMFDTDGCLVNGQHRAAAIAKAGRSVTATVAYDCTEKEWKQADQKIMPRSNSDALHYAGITNASNKSAIAAAILRDYAGGWITPSSNQCVEFVLKHGSKFDEAQKIVNRCKVSGTYVNPSILAAVWFVASENYPEIANSFAYAVADKTPGQRGDAAWSLLKRFEDDRKRITGKMSRPVKMAITIKAFNYWNKGTHPPFLRWSPGQNEEWPQIK